MINKDTLITVINKYNGTVGYDIPDSNMHRNFYPNETKEITFGELEKLFYAPGGNTILEDFLEITNEEAINKLFYSKVEPEYHYTIKDVKTIMQKGSLDQFLDLLDFSPEALKENIKELAVDLPLNDLAKRQAILEKLGFDVSKAIEIKKVKYDGAEDKEIEVKDNRPNGRRTAPIKKEEMPAPSGRRYKPENTTV